MNRPADERDLKALEDRVKLLEDMIRLLTVKKKAPRKRKKAS